MNTPASSTWEDALAQLHRSRELRHVGSGKVRDIFEIPGRPDLLAVFVTDHWSARDFVFGFSIPGIGIIRNIMSICWKRRLRNAGIETDLVAYGRVVDDYLPQSLRGNHEVWKRLTIVSKLDMLKFELIYRFNAVGGIYTASASGKDTFCGNSIQPHMQYGAGFCRGIATPTTKEQSGHDVNVSWQEVEQIHPGAIEFGSRIARHIRVQLARGSQGNLIDIKIEIGKRPVTGEYVLGDEISPDSCRFCNRTEYGKLRLGERIHFLDKEFGRTWADGKGIGNLDPENPVDIERVKTWTGEPEFLEEFIRGYRQACVLNTGHTPEEYLKWAMAIE